MRCAVNALLMLWMCGLRATILDTVDEVARCIDFLAGVGGAFITGQVLHVDGGASLAAK